MQLGGRAIVKPLIDNRTDLSVGLFCGGQKDVQQVMGCIPTSRVVDQSRLCNRSRFVLLLGYVFVVLNSARFVCSVLCC